MEFNMILQILRGNNCYMNENRPVLSATYFVAHKMYF